MIFLLFVFFMLSLFVSIFLLFCEFLYLRH
uniref:Uncharacterized protein n=1 Tax=Octopus bimaculoides TaxID=37653 RepID=A0A0L8I6B9_OCTBM